MFTMGMVAPLGAQVIDLRRFFVAEPNGTGSARGLAFVRHTAPGETTARQSRSTAETKKYQDEPCNTEAPYALLMLEVFPVVRSGLFWYAHVHTPDLAFGSGM